MAECFLDVYRDHPLDDGDAVVVIDDEVCLEVQGLADHWDGVLREDTTQALLSTADRVLVAIARPRGRLQERDHQLWRDLQDALGGRGVELLPVHALPAAA